jgi:hypothetical protein
MTTGRMSESLTLLGFEFDALAQIDAGCRKEIVPNRIRRNNHLTTAFTYHNAIANVIRERNIF